LTEEVVRIPPDVLGFISLRTTWKFRGLINVSGFHVDPGFHGNLIYAVYNAGPAPVHLARGMDLFLIWFAELDKLVDRR
jgi:dCTP deaminase